MSDTRFSMVICTCDAYSDAWHPLFTLFERYWPELKNIPIVLNTETASYQHEGFDIVSPQLYKDHPSPASVPWSKRLRRTLQEVVDAEVVLIYLDDFYLRSRVNADRFDVCLSYLEQDQKIANIQLFTCPLPYTPVAEYPWLLKRDKRSPYLFSLQAGLWRRDRLLHFLRDHESPWYFERWGSLRGRRYPDDFYALATIDGKLPILDYCPSTQGVSKGLWLPQTPELFEKEGIEIDLSARGVMPYGWKPPRRRRNWFATARNIFRSLCP